MLRSTVVLAMALLVAGPARAQLNLEVSQRVRIVAPGAGISGTVAGTVVQLSTHALLLQTASAQLRVPLGAISRIERSRGRARLLTGGLGAAAGAGAGYGLAEMVDRQKGIENVKVPCELSRECPLEFRWVPRDPFGPGDRALYTAAGLLVGGAVGALLGRERWERVPLYARPTPGAHGAGVAVGVRF